MTPNFIFLGVLVLKMFLINLNRSIILKFARNFE